MQAARCIHPGQCENCLSVDFSFCSHVGQECQDDGYEARRKRPKSIDGTGNLSPTFTPGGQSSPTSQTAAPATTAASEAAVASRDRGESTSSAPLAVPVASLDAAALEARDDGVVPMEGVEVSSYGEAVGGTSCPPTGQSSQQASVTVCASGEDVTEMANASCSSGRVGDVAGVGSGTDSAGEVTLGGVVAEGKVQPMDMERDHKGVGADVGAEAVGDQSNETTSVDKVDVS